MNLLILGAAVSGRAAARLGRRLGHAITIYDEDTSSLDGPAADGYEVRGGDWDPRLLEPVDAVVTSPGIPEPAKPIRDSLASGAPVWSEMEFAARHLSQPYLAVTGTNGKTTVTAATADMLRAGGVDAVAAGNIGTALSDIVGTSYEVVVVEASSFQLRFIETFHPVGAAILNITADHLDWHGDVEAYRAAKSRIFENQKAGDVLVFDADDPGASMAVKPARSTKVPISGRERPAGGNGPDGDHLLIGRRRFPRPQLDPAFMVDVAAAATLASHLGASDEGVREALGDFAPGDHRRTVVGSWDAVTWIDDSKATNPHAAAASAAAYSSVILIAGGRNKGLDLGRVTNVPSVRAVVALGEAQDELAALTDAGRFHPVATLQEAVAAADQLAAAGDVVLLAPGCASFDMFDSYAHRGDVFAALVLAHKGGAT